MYVGLHVQYSYLFRIRGFHSVIVEDLVWDVTLFHWVNGRRRFEGSWCLCLQGSRRLLSVICPIVTEIGMYRPIFIRNPNIKITRKSSRRNSCISCGRTERLDEVDSCFSPLFWQRALKLILRKELLCEISPEMLYVFACARCYPYSPREQKWNSLRRNWPDVWNSRTAVCNCMYAYPQKFAKQTKRVS